MDQDIESGSGLWKEIGLMEREIGSGPPEILLIRRISKAETAISELHHRSGLRAQVTGVSSRRGGASARPMAPACPLVSTPHSRAMR
ncbi:hypothetical protein EVAR_16022_1 [Eumeta japonica]|uniref:Uncharacterized protein n=1 Tax=Eumeta variegata TaxID=151549 RepID=A0A4C1VW93_EUMVA|nr:hypothetical protein EVAR_16022_1 [Eumeta japonica]